VSGTDLVLGMTRVMRLSFEKQCMPVSVMKARCVSIRECVFLRHCLGIFSDICWCLLVVVFAADYSGRPALLLEASSCLWLLPHIPPIWN
jgi:hypothetical protein